MRKHFVFVMEQGLGHVVHTLNLEHVLRTENDIDATVLRIRPDDAGWTSNVPVAGNWSIQMSMRTRRALAELIRTGRPDAVFIHTQVAALFSTKIMREVPTVVSLDATPVNFDTMSDAYRHHRQSAGLEQMKLWINRRALARSAAVVTWSEWAAESVVDDYGVPAARVHPIFPGVQIEKFQPTRKVQRGPLRVLFVGGDFIRKGGGDLVEAIASLEGLVELDMVTSSTPDPPLPDDVPIRLHFGVSPNSERLLTLMDRADVFALPSRGDCTPLAVAEAMASGLPVVATTVGAMPNMVCDGYNGILVPPGDSVQIANALRTLASDGHLRQRMGAASRALAEDQHDAAKNWQRIFHLMAAAADGRPDDDFSVPVASGPHRLRG
jgi:glycosyltransferase involved in cell wall biosynthesis